jgi:hypothetical protein
MEAGLGRRGYCEATHGVDVGDVEVDVLAREVAERGLGERLVGEAVMKVERRQWVEM